jgi:hypothetical protein
MVSATDVIMLMSNRIVRDVFEKVVNKRSVLFKDLLREIAVTAAVSAASCLVESGVSRHLEAGGADHSEGDLSPSELNAAVADAVTRLKDANLIKEVEASIPDFSALYPTSEGLGVERKLGLGSDKNSEASTTIFSRPL